MILKESKSDINWQVYVTQSVYEHVCLRLYDKMYIYIYMLYLFAYAKQGVI